MNFARGGPYSLLEVYIGPCKRYAPGRGGPYSLLEVYIGPCKRYALARGGPSLEVGPW